jgi:6-phosphofructokinase 1
VEYESEASSGAACGNGVVAGIDEDTCLALPEWAIRSGPRKTVYFDPEKARGAGSGVWGCGGAAG